MEEHPLLQLIHRRTSAEKFDPGRSFDESLIRGLVLDATQAPSSFNIQHWRFIAIRRAEDKERLQEASYGQEQITRAAVTFILVGDSQAADRLPEILDVAIERGAITEGKAAAWVRMAKGIYSDPQLARDEAIRSCSLAAMTLMLAAEARGLLAGALTGFDPEKVKREFDIPDRYIPVMLVALGYGETGETQRMPRLAVDDVLSFDRFRKG